MKTKSILPAVLGLAFIGSASAADLTIYYSPTCPHCHHAREFINNTLVYEYPTIKITEVNVMDDANLTDFRNMLKKCKFESGGVPVVVIGDKCEQGYADFVQDTWREHIESDMSDEDKLIAANNKAEMAKDADAFRAAHADRANAFVADNVASIEEPVVVADATVAADKDDKSNVWFWGLLVALVAGLGVVLFRKNNRK